MISYKMYEKNLSSSINVNVMHLFWKSEILAISLKICIFQCLTVYVLMMKNLVPVSDVPSQIYFVTQSKDSRLKWYQT